VLLIGLFAYATSLWLGLYLLARSPHKASMRRAGVGLLAYGLALATDLLGVTPEAGPLARLVQLLFIAPAVCWSGAMLALLPEQLPWPARANRYWLRAFVPLCAALGLGAVLAREPLDGLFLTLLTIAAALELVVALALVLHARKAIRPAPVRGLLAVATLFFGLGFALLGLPLSWAPRPVVLIAIGIDLELLGLAVALWDAFDEGETLQRDMLRSFAGAGGAALLFGGQIAIAMALVETPDLLPLLITSVGAAIVTQVLSGTLAAWADRLVLRAPAMELARAELRASAEALPRIDTGFDLGAADGGEFVRLTRRALSHYGDLPRLASSPLTRLPQIDERLRARSAPDHPLERAAELRELLREGIERLRPRGEATFGTSDAWRYYNALYFPYVVGLRPYSKRSSPDSLEPDARQALDWLSTMVPERTLHNWQNAAARLVAEDLRAKAAEPGVPAH
jgi:hypothetical protein